MKNLWQSDAKFAFGQPSAGGDRVQSCVTGSIIIVTKNVAIRGYYGDLVNIPRNLL